MSGTPEHRGSPGGPTKGPRGAVMKKRILVAGAVVVLVAAGCAVGATRSGLWPGGAIAQAPRQNAPRAVPVEIVTAVKKVVPVRLEVLGTVTPIASVAVKPRVDSEITGVHFRDGALVNQGDLLFTLDGRTIEAQARQVEGLLAGAKANLEQAERDVARYTELLAKNATTLVTLLNARTQVNIWRSSVDSNTAQLENLNIQLGYCTIRAPITGRASMAAVKVGNLVRPTPRRWRPSSRRRQSTSRSRFPRATCRICAKRSTTRARPSRRSFPAIRAGPAGRSR